MMLYSKKCDSKNLLLPRTILLGLAALSLICFTGFFSPDQVACKTSESDPGYRVGVYDTSWPADMANLNRSNAVNNSGFPRGTKAEDIKVDTVEMPFPSFAYSRDEDEIFVLGGAPFTLGTFVDMIDKKNQNTQGEKNVNNLSQKELFQRLMGGNKPEPHLTKYNPVTGEIKKIELLKGKTVPYVGGALIHKNGYVYVISQSYLYKIDGDSTKVVQSVQLPVAPKPHTPMTIYNGLSVSSTGELITKYWVLDNPASKFLLIDPDSLKITFELDYPGASPRLTVAKDQDDNEYLYHLNKRNTFRFLIKRGSLELDEDWQSRFDPYETGKDENEEPTSPVIAGDKVFYTTNTSFLSHNPMRIFWQSTKESYGLDDVPLTGPYLFDDASGPGWNFFHLSIDDTTGTIIGTDQSNGLITAIRINRQDKVERLWQKEMKVSARPAIVSDREMVYTTDYVNGHNDLVVLDLKTGEELVRKSTEATRATIATIIVTRNNEVYFGSNEPGKATGLFHRFYID